MNECSSCNQIFVTKYELRCHHSIYSDCSVLNTKSLECFSCLKSFATKSNLDRHIKICNINKIIEPYKLKIQELVENFTNDIDKLKNTNIQILNELEFYKNQVEELKANNRILQDKIGDIAISAVSRPINTTINN